MLVDETEVETLSQVVKNLEFRKFFPAGPDLHSNYCQTKKKLQILFKQQKDSCCARSSNSDQFVSGRDENGRNVLIIWERGWNWLRFMLLDDQVAKIFFFRKKIFPAAGDSQQESIYWKYITKTANQSEIQEPVKSVSV